MPWDEIESGKRADEISEVKNLISMRHSLQSCKSRNFHFPNDVEGDRVLSYMKIGDNETLQIYLNCEDKEVEISCEGFEEVVYSRKWNKTDSGKGMLEANGILIMRK
jgi:hypothetical protein